MAKGTKDKFGYLGTEPMALREQLNELTAALEELAQAEGAEAMKTAGEAVRRIVGQASQLADEFADTAQAAAAAAGQGRNQVEGAVRDNPWIAISLAAAAGFLLATLVRR